MFMDLFLTDDNLNRRDLIDQMDIIEIREQVGSIIVTIPFRSGTKEFQVQQLQLRSATRFLQGAFKLDMKGNWREKQFEIIMNSN